jgi:hypothetical protein
MPATAGAVNGQIQVNGQVQGGIGDPLTLAASGVVIPFFTSGVLGTVATLQVASPVANNPDAHMFFFDSTCARIPISVGIPLTTNDIAFQQIGSAQGGPVASGTDGLITLARADFSGFTLLPFLDGNPVHARLYEFNAENGRSLVLEPIVVNTAEFPSVAHWWSPLRTAATFFAPLQTTGIHTDLVLICPLATIEGLSGAAFGADPGGAGDAQFTNTGFPQINPRFPSAFVPNQIRVRLYDTNEVFKRDFTISCHCTEGFVSIADSISPFYANADELPGGSYTELTSVPSAPSRTTFTGYSYTYTVGSAINAFFGRLQNGSQLSIDGPAVTSTR